MGLIFSLRKNKKSYQTKDGEELDTPSLLRYYQHTTKRKDKMLDIDKEIVEVTNTCTCEEEDGTEAEWCFGCYEDALSMLSDTLKNWVKANGKPSTTIRIDGSLMGWQRLDGYAIKDLEDLPHALEINGDYRIEYRLDGKDLTAIRYSHDEPTGASFQFSFVPDEELLIY